MQKDTWGEEGGTKGYGRGARGGGGDLHWHGTLKRCVQDTVRGLTTKYRKGAGVRLTWHTEALCPERNANGLPVRACGVQSDTDRSRPHEAIT
jgi:hypothetical protein